MKTQYLIGLYPVLNGVDLDDNRLVTSWLKLRYRGEEGTRAYAVTIRVSHDRYNGERISEAAVSSITYR